MHLLFTHADRQGVDISFTVCLFVQFVRLRISPPRLKLAASNFAQWFVGSQDKKSQIFVNFAPPEAQNWTNRHARGPRPPACKHNRKRHARDAPIVQYRAACGRRIGMCGYRSVPTDVLVSTVCLLNRVTFELSFCICVGHDRSSSGTASQGHRSRSRSTFSAYGRGNAVTRSVCPRSSIEDTLSLVLAKREKGNW